MEEPVSVTPAVATTARWLHLDSEERPMRDLARPRVVGCLGLPGSSLAAAVTATGQRCPGASPAALAAAHVCGSTDPLAPGGPQRCGVGEIV